MQQTTFFGKLTTRPSIFLVLAGLLIAMAAAPMAAGAQGPPAHAGTDQIRDALNIDLNQAVNYAEDEEAERQDGWLVGTVNVSEFDVDNGELFAIGDIDATVYEFNGFNEETGDPILGDEVETLNVTDRAIPVGTGGGNDLGIMQENGADRCPILFLELGPVFLDVLGLVVEIPDPIVLDIYAERGPGKLLGNLLCAIVGILDPVVEPPVQTPLDQLIGNLNRLLERILGPA
jgi:hypothetical protein